MKKDTMLAGFYKLDLNERRRILKEKIGLTEDDLKILEIGLPLERANIMSENVIGEFQLPLAIATNFMINGRQCLVPMVTEEPSVVAAASHAAKLALPSGFHTSSSRPVMRGQIQIVDINDLEVSVGSVSNAKEELITKANQFAGSLPNLGGGVIDLQIKTIISPKKMIVVEFFVDCRDAMGANSIDRIVEGMAPEIEKMTGGRALLKIISNLATERMAKATVSYKSKVIGGAKVVDGIIDAYNFACADVYRATTNNKGIMNGIIAVVLATANDTRAVEAGAHAYASLTGRYMPLARWSRDDNGDLKGELEMPLAVGTVGGATKTHPTASIVLKILGVGSAQELSEIICSVGLAQNFAALKALVTEGIQKGHMKLHARNVAIMAGASGINAEKIAEMLIEEGNVRVSRAKELLENGQLK